MWNAADKSNQEPTHNATAASPFAASARVAVEHPWLLIAAHQGPHSFPLSSSVWAEEWFIFYLDFLFFFFFKLTPLWRLIALSCKGEKINSCWSMAGRCFFSWSLICYLFSIFEIKILLQSPQIAENTPLLPSLRSLLPPIRAWHYQRCAFCFAFRVVWKFWAVNNVPVWLRENYSGLFPFHFFFLFSFFLPFPSYLSFSTSRNGR